MFPDQEIVQSTMFLTFYGRDLEDFRTILVENGFLLPRSLQTDASLIWSNVKSLKWWQKISAGDAKHENHILACSPSPI